MNNYSWIFKIFKSQNLVIPKPSLESNHARFHKKLGPIGSAVLTFIGYKQTGKIYIQSRKLGRKDSKLGRKDSKLKRKDSRLEEKDSKLEKKDSKLEKE